MRSSLLFLMLIVCPVIASAQRSDFDCISFKRADSIASLYPNHSLHDLPLLAVRLTEHLPSEAEKFRAIFMWVCTNISNDYRLFALTERKRKRLTDPIAFRAWSTDFNKEVFQKLVRDHATICSGYAYLINELATLAGLEAEVVNGYGRTSSANIGGEGFANHSWNAVMLFGKWYLCDATWSSGWIGAEHKFVKHYDDVYFLTDPDVFAQNHYPLDKTWQLTTDSLSLRQFLDAPLVYRHAYRFDIKVSRESKFDLRATGNNPVELTFRSLRLPGDSVEVKTMHGSSADTRTLPVYYSQNTVTLRPTFKTRGVYTLHILVDHQTLMTYSIHVTD